MGRTLAVSYTAVKRFLQSLVDYPLRNLSLTWAIRSASPMFVAVTNLEDVGVVSGSFFASSLPFSAHCKAASLDNGKLTTVEGKRSGRPGFCGSPKGSA